MNPKRLVGVCLTLVTLQPVATAVAQVSTPTEGLTLTQALTSLTSVAGSASSGQAIALSTAIEVATAPLGTSSAGFAFELDPTTGLQVRKATTFGPAFADRVLTMGAGKMSVAANLAVATYDRLGDFKLIDMKLSSIAGTSPGLNQTGRASLAMSSQTMVLYGAIGATETLDLSVAVPVVKVKLEGLSWVDNELVGVSRRAEAAGVSTGLGDIALMAKYRLLKFGEGNPDPGGLAIVGTMRLPTGDRDNLRGLGVTRTLASVVASAGRGRFRPHGSAGFEFWSAGIEVATHPEEPTSATAKHQIQYAGGVEYEATPKVTLIGDLIGRHILGAGRVDLRSFEPDPAAAKLGVTSIEAVVGLPQGIRKITLAPGLKWNVKGTVLVSVSALIPLFDQGVYDQFTPVVGLDWTF
ncbi:MAG TPA: hypothetical protein VM820_09195 [Vicinamibacterales bacterium]|nr:hypothetical protein [Vicinamibacterales bacterium]